MGDLGQKKRASSYPTHYYLYKTLLTSATLPGSISAIFTGQSPLTLNPYPWTGGRVNVTFLGADQLLLALKIAIGPCVGKIVMVDFLNPLNPFLFLLPFVCLACF